MIQLILSDLDETLLNDDGTIHPENIAAIQAFTQNGGYFVPNTGRSYKSVYGTLAQLGLNKTTQYVVSYNGGAIVAIAPDGQEEIVVEHGMSLTLAQKIFDLGQVNDVVDTHVYTRDNLYIYNISATDQRYMTERQVPYTEITTTDLSFMANEGPVMKVIL